MAGIPMYHGTSTFGEIEAKRARQRMDVLKTEEAEIDLDDYKKSKELMKKSAIKKLADSQTNEPTPVPTMSTKKEQMPSYQSQDMGMEQAPTEFATAPTTDANPTSPFGTYEQRGAESPADMPYGFGGAIPKDYKSLDQVLQTQVEPSPGQEQPPTEGQPQEQAPVEGYNQPPSPQETAPPPVNNIATKAKKATLDFTEANDEVESAYKLAEMFKQQGLLKPYYEQLKVAGNLEEKRTMAQTRRIAAAKDIMEITGRIAGGYVEVAKRTNDPVELERAWQSSLMLLDMNGIPAGQLRAMTDPRARLAIAEKYADASMSAAKKLELEYKRVKFVEQNRLAKKGLEIKERLADEKTKMDAWKRDTGNRKMEQKEITTYLKEGKDKVASLQTTLKGKQATLEKLTSSNTYFDSETGLLLDPETQAKEIILARQEVENLETQIELERQRIATWTAKLKPGSKDTTGKPTTENANAPPPEVIQDTIKALNANPSKALLDHVKAKFKEAYPDLEFEKYIKVNPAKYK